jgi:NitT/TauT family transport system substrate-binding protein
MRVATVSEVPTPWLCLQEDLRQAGIDPAQLDRVADRSMAENLLALREGRIDAAQLFEPVVEEALASGAGHLWHSASERGRTTYTAFVTTRDRLVGGAEPLLRMVRAIHRTQQWIHACSAAELAATVSPFFPAFASGVLTGAIARYQAQGVLGARPGPSRRRFRPFAKQPSGFIRRPASYAACVDNRFARWVLAV